MNDLGSTGRVLDWCYLCGVEIPFWRELHKNSVSNNNIFDYSIEDFCAFCQGLGRYEPEWYQQWLDNFYDDVLGYIRLQIDCVSLEILDGTASFSFLVSAGQDFNDQAVSRLKRIRSALPLCGSYRSQGIWGMPYGLPPPIDETTKTFGSDNFQFESDLTKDRTWGDIVEKYYLPESFHRYEDEWCKLRSHAISCLSLTSRLLAKILSRSKVSKDLIEKGNSAMKSLKLALHLRLDPPLQTPTSIKENLKATANKWAYEMANFLNQVSEYSRSRNKRDGNLAALSFHNAYRLVMEMHSAFDALFTMASDYFGAKDMNSKELKVHAEVEDHLYAWIVDPPVTSITDVSAYSKARRRQKEETNLRRISQAFGPLTEAGISVIFPNGIYEEESLTHVPIAVSVQDPIHPEKALTDALNMLSKAHNAADIVYVVPLYKGMRLIQGAYRFNAGSIGEMLSNRVRLWDYLPLPELPEPIRALLPILPYSQPIGLEILGSVNALLGQLYPLVLLNDYAANLELSSNKFDIAQSQHLRSRLEILVDEAKGLAGKTYKLITSEFPHPDSDTLLEGSIEFLTAIMSAEGPHDLIALHKSLQPNEMLIINSLIEKIQTILA